MITALIMMAGKGSRMNLEENKALLKINNEHIFLISAKKFVEKDINVILVVSKNDYEYVNSIAPNYKIVIGGNTRQESVYNGLKEVKTKYVLIHDAARPLISKYTINELIDSFEENKALLVGSKVNDTIKIKENNKLKTLDRNLLYAAQTPQGALTKTLLNVHEKALIDGYQTTDDIALIEKYSNLDIKLIESDSSNFKITTIDDLKIATYLLGEKND